MAIVFLIGKDQIIFVTQADHEKSEKQRIENSAISPLDLAEEEPEGLIKANGEINWDCPCLQGMADGPCGEPFKDAFSCFHYSEAEPKGVDCIDQFKSMQECFVKYPELYGAFDDDEPPSKTAEKQGQAEEALTTNDLKEEISEGVERSTEKTGGFPENQKRSEGVASVEEKIEKVIISDNEES